MYIHIGVVFHAVFISCLWWWLPHNHDWKAITWLFGNWRCHIGFQEETRRGVSLYAAEVDAGKRQFSRKNVLLQTLSPWLLHKHWSGSRTPGVLQLFIKGMAALLLPWLQIMGFITTSDSDKKGHHTGGGSQSTSHLIIITIIEESLTYKWRAGLFSG